MARSQMRFPNLGRRDLFCQADRGRHSLPSLYAMGAFGNGVYGFSAEIEKYSRKIQKNSAQRCSAMFNVNLRDPCPKSNGLDWELK